MKRTTIYLSDEQKRGLRSAAGESGRTESDLIREGVDQVLRTYLTRRRRPGPLFALDDPVLDDPERVDEALEGFGAE